MRLVSAPDIARSFRWRPCGGSSFRSPIDPPAFLEVRGSWCSILLEFASSWRHLLVVNTDVLGRGREVVSPMIVVPPAAEVVKGTGRMPGGGR